MKIEYRHSASKTNTFIDSPAFWIINELYDFESSPNARMIMGLAAEDAAITHYKTKSPMKILSQILLKQNI